MAGVCRRELLGGRNRRQPVMRDHGNECGGLGTWRQQVGDAREHRLVAAEDAPQQRSPGEVDRERSGQAAQRLRRVLGGRDYEERVRQPVAAHGAAGCVGHRGGARVQADHERVWPLGRGAQHEAAVARSEVNGNLGVLRGEASDVADVVLVDPAAPNHAKHGRSVGASGSPPM